MTKSHEQSSIRGMWYHVLRCMVTEEDESLYNDPTKLLIEMDNPIAFVSQPGDTMYLIQALKEPDRAQFI